MKPIGGNLYFKNFTDFDFQLIRAFAFDKNFSIDFGEAMATAFNITEGDFESWYSEWQKTGDRLAAYADESLSNNHIVSAREFYLQAAVCYRTADFYIRQNLNDARLIPLADKQRNAFRKAGNLFNPKFRTLEIPYEQTTLPAYLFLSDDSGKPKPTLIFTGGYDSFVEETFYYGVYSALKRGYNCLSFDGPGQGQVLRRQKLFFRPDWENVVKPVIDFALTIPEIDKEKMILIGRSFGGYLAPRAACFEHRICALVADAVLYNIGAAAKKMLPPDLVELIQNKNDAKAKVFFDEMFKDKAKEFYFVSRMSTHGAKTPMEYIRMLEDYSVQGIAKNISCPAFLSSGELDVMSAEMSRQLYDELTCPKHIEIFKAIDGAGEHCEFSSQTIFFKKAFDWMDETIRI